jgi:hypothetical protein
LTVEIGPEPPHDLPTKITKRILTPFLIKTHLFNRLSRLEQPAVFDLSVKLADGPLFFPTEVNPRDEPSVQTVDLTLWLGSRQTRFVDAYPADGLPRALASSVKE